MSLETGTPFGGGLETLELELFLSSIQRMPDHIDLVINFEWSLFLHKSDPLACLHAPAFLLLEQATPFELIVIALLVGVSRPSWHLLCPSKAIEILKLN